MSGTRAYFDAMNRMQEEIKERRYSTALLALKEGLRVAPTAFDAMRSELGSLPPSIPFIDTTAGAIASLFNDAEAFSLMEAVSAKAQRESRVPEFKDDAAAMEAYRHELASKGESSLLDIKKLGPVSTRSRASRLLSWLEKNREITISGTGSKKVVHWGGAEIKPLLMQPAFRGQEKPVRPTSVKETRAGIFVANQLPPGSKIPQMNPRTISSELLPPEARQPGNMRLHQVGDLMWLIGSSKRLADGASYETPYRVLDTSGAIVVSGALSYGVVRAFSSSARPYFLAIDHTLDLHIHEPNGSEVRGFSFSGNPEVEAATAAGEGKKHLAVRSVDIHPVTGEIAFAVTHNFFRFRSDGSPVSAFTYSHDEARGMSIGLGAGSNGSASASPLMMEVGDWVYFVQFSDYDDSVFVGLYSGQLIRYSASGDVLARWNLHSSVVSLHEYEGILLVLTNHVVFLLAENGQNTGFPVLGNAFVTDGFVVSHSKREVMVLDLESLEQSLYEVSKDIKAVYPAKGKVRIYQTTAFSVIELRRSLSHGPLYG